MPTQVAVGEQKSDDLEALVRHVKEDMFAKVKFICDQKADLAVEGAIHNDHKRKCKDKIGGQDPRAVMQNAHLHGVWTDALTKHMQKNAQAQQRSAACTLMQNEFSCDSAHGFFTATRVIPRCH
jgi:hypothetical protein